MDYLPIFLDIRGKPVLVDGGGTMAARRVERALSAGATVALFDPEPGEECLRLIGTDRLVLHRRIPEPSDFDGCAVAYGASDDPARDDLLVLSGRAAGALVNVADVIDACDFITPSVVDRSPVVVAIASGGAAPVIARILRARIEAMLPPAYGRLARFVGGFRDRVAARLADGRVRRRFWERVIDGPVGDLLLADNSGAAESALEAEIETAAVAPAGGGGEVYLVGAGPGDPDLLTFRALRLMQRADVVLYDRLVGKGVVSLVRRDAERIYVGKLPKQHTMAQDDITRLMVKHARAGRRVLRLKGGDPFIFGRGGEEIETLAAEGIPFQVVPGITAAAGCGAYAGIPLTHRDHAQSCLFVTAHGRDGVLDLDWDVLLRPAQTVAIYMGLSSLETLSREAIARGADPETPAAIIDNGTCDNQRVVTGTLADLPEQARRADLRGPSMIILGSVVLLRDKLDWHGDGHRGDESTGHRMSLQPQEAL